MFTARKQPLNILRSQIWNVRKYTKWFNSCFYFILLHLNLTNNLSVPHPLWCLQGSGLSSTSFRINMPVSQLCNPIFWISNFLKIFPSDPVNTFVEYSFQNSQYLKKNDQPVRSMYRKHRNKHTDVSNTHPSLFCVFSSAVRTPHPKTE